MTIALVFGPKVSYGISTKRNVLSECLPQVIRVLRGQGDQWDNRARSRGVTASFSLNGIGLMPEEAPDLYQENEELKVGYGESLNFVVIFRVLGRNSKIGSSNRVYEDCSHGNE